MYSYFLTLHQTRFALAAKILLGSQNWDAKEYNVSLAVVENRQENVIPWLLL